MARGYETVWNFHDTHLDPTIDSADPNKFLSAARCVLYAAPGDRSANSGTAEFVRAGVVQGYNWSEQKDMEMIFELGSDVPYFIPGRTTGQIQVQRVLLSGENFLNLAYNRDSQALADSGTTKQYIRSIRDINIPMDLLFVFYGVPEDSDTYTYTEAYSRLFKNCWIQSNQESISAGQILVAESVNIVYEYCSSAKAYEGGL